jgi:hypothetical protein
MAGAGIGGQILAGNQASGRQGRLIEHQPRYRVAHGRAQGANGAIGVARQRGLRTRDGKHCGNILILALDRIRPNAFAALGAAAPVHGKTGKAIRQQPGHRHPVGVRRDAAMHKDNRGAAAQAAKADARSVGRAHRSLGHRRRRMLHN